MSDDAPTLTIDGVAHRAPGAELTGAELLALAGRDPDRYALYATGHHGLRIDPEQALEVREGARFETRPR